MALSDRGVDLDVGVPGAQTGDGVVEYGRRVAGRIASFGNWHRVAEARRRMPRCDRVQAALSELGLPGCPLGCRNR